MVVLEFKYVCWVIEKDVYSVGKCCLFYDGISVWASVSRTR
jgi:hypothetical protein